MKKQQFEELQKNFIKAVIEGTNVFLHTNPQELQRYRDFVEQNKPFDVIVDGLNVAYHQGGGGAAPGKEHGKRLARQVSYTVPVCMDRFLNTATGIVQDNSPSTVKITILFVFSL